MICPTCGSTMTPGFVQAGAEVYFTEKPHKLLFSAKRNDVVLTHHNTSPTGAAWHCPV